jgi:hypothetical protein
MRPAGVGPFRRAPGRRLDASTARRRRTVDPQEHPTHDPHAAPGPHGTGTALGRPGTHAAHEHPAHPAPSSWRTAARATLHCLIGCAVGEILGLVVGTAAGLPNGTTVALSIALAFLFGYALTMRGVLRADVPLRQAVKLALAADTVSIAVMELIDNTVMVGVPGAMDAGLPDVLFWGALAGSLALAFAVTTPVNKWMIGRGRGHAVVHADH